MRSHPSRPAGVAVALLAVAWAFFLLPPQQAVWSGAGIAPWLGVLDSMPVYDALRLWLASLGWDDFYMLFGAAAAASFLLIWLATGPTLQAVGWSGHVMSWLFLGGAALTLASYLSHEEGNPFRALWGAEGVVLLVIGIWGLVVAVAARRRFTPGWLRVLLAATLPVVAAATLLLTYYPHGSLVGLGLQAAAIAAWGPRLASGVAQPRTENPVAS